MAIPTGIAGVTIPGISVFIRIISEAGMAGTPPFRWFIIRCIFMILTTGIIHLLITTTDRFNPGRLVEEVLSWHAATAVREYPEVVMMDAWANHVFYLHPKIMMIQTAVGLQHAKAGAREIIVTD